MTKRTIRQLVTVYSDGSIEVATKGAGARFNPTTRGTAAKVTRGRGTRQTNRAQYRAKFGRKSATF